MWVCVCVCVCVCEWFWLWLWVGFAGPGAYDAPAGDRGPQPSLSSRHELLGASATPGVVHGRVCRAWGSVVALCWEVRARREAAVWNLVGMFVVVFLGLAGGGGCCSQALVRTTHLRGSEGLGTA